MKALSNIWRTVALSACTAVVVSGMIACSAEDSTVKEEQTLAAQQEGLKVTLTATFDDGAATRGVSFGSDGSSSNSTFSVGDKIYIYNKTFSKQERNYLTVSHISDDGKTADFSGTLDGRYTHGNALELYYNVSYYNENHLDLSRFDYQGVLNGSASSASACDYAIANATVSSVRSGTLKLTAPVTLQKMQSVFRQRLTFKDTNDGEPITPNIVQLTVSSLENKLNWLYFLNGDAYEMPIAIPNPTIDSNKDIYLALHFSDGSTSSDALTFTAIASNGNVYVGTKTAPSGGFKNGKYYYGNLTLVKSDDKVLPTISWYNVEAEVNPDVSNTYIINPKNGYIDIGLSGISKDYRFQWACGNSFVRLNNFTAKWKGSNIEFIQANNTNFVLDIIGTNTIECRNSNYCISNFDPGSNRIIKLSGSGTLTVTAKSKSFCGIYGYNYQNIASSTYPNSNLYFKDDAQDVTAQLAADGYTVQRSARSGSGSGPYTWTYTVSPKLVEPTITWTTVVSPVKLNDYGTYKQYQVSPSGDVIDFKLRGNSSAYTFNLRPSTSATVHLNNLNALNADQSSFIYNEGSGTLTLNLTGTNIINCRNWEQCIYSEDGLKLSGNGTLTVTSNNVNRVGIYGYNYNIMTNSNDVTDGTADVSTLAAPGSTVTRSAMTNNNNGTYTWTYTVTTP